jgi:hypothetical protein
MRNLVIEAPHNDVLYGCTNANYCGGVDPALPGAASSRKDLHVMGPRGRGINFLPRHVNNRDRIAQGLAPARATTQAGEPLLEDAATARPLLWIPAVNLDTLADRNPRVTVQGIHWKDGACTLEVPPLVRQLGRLEDLKEGGS